MRRVEVLRRHVTPEEAHATAAPAAGAGTVYAFAPSNQAFEGPSSITISDGIGSTFSLAINKHPLDFEEAIAHQVAAKVAGHAGEGAVDPANPVNKGLSHSLRHAAIDDVLSPEGLKQLRQAANMTWRRFSAAESQTTTSGIGTGIPTRFDHGQVIMTEWIGLGLSLEQSSAVQTRSNYFRETFYYNDYGIVDPRFEELLNSPKLADAAKTIFGVSGFLQLNCQTRMTHHAL